MRIIKPLQRTVLALAVGTLTQAVFAMDEHADHAHAMQEQSMPAVDHSMHSMQPETQQAAPPAINQHAEHTVTAPQNSSVTQHQHSADHRREHGGQIYQATEIDSRWLNNSDGQGKLKTELESRIGTDENKLFIKLHADKAESQDADYAAQLMYSRMISDFWDVQTGARYRFDEKHVADKEQWDAAIGLHGLAPYFFETDAYLFVGQDKQVSFLLETERDLLLTQKLILKPYLNIDVVLNDDSRYAQKTGLSSLWLGLETRYEINKKVMPFIDVSYSYDKGAKHTAWQQGTESEKDWWYGAGLRVKF